jgi:hypothetical protein
MKARKTLCARSIIHFFLLSLCFTMLHYVRKMNLKLPISTSNAIFSIHSQPLTFSFDNIDNIDNNSMLNKQCQLFQCSSNCYFVIVLSFYIALQCCFSNCDWMNERMIHSEWMKSKLKLEWQIKDYKSKSLTMKKKKSDIPKINNSFTL